MPTASYKERLKSLPEGSNYGRYKNSRYLVTKSTLLNNRLIKLYAIELGGNDLVSGNYYGTIKNGLLRPCEMSDEKVIDFILNLDFALESLEKH